MTSIVSSRRILLLVVGDVLAFVFSLIFTLTIRYEAIPSRALFFSHVPSFAILFVLFLIVSFSAGLYDKQSTLIRGRIQGLLLRVQVINLIISIIFFYLAPVGIAPRANLFIYILISTAALLTWRMVMFPVLNSARKQTAVLVGSGEDVEDLHEEINGSTHYGLVFKDRVLPQMDIKSTVDAISTAVKKNKASIIVVDLHNQVIESAMPFLYSLIFSGVQIIDASKLYESLFDRIPLSMVGERWLVENSVTVLGNRRIYDVLKRLMDIVVVIVVGIISLVLYPFVWASIKTEDNGPIFIVQERIGKNGKHIGIAKFRSMTANDGGSYSNNNGKSKLKVTHTGKFTRLTRIDELPQLWSVLKGDQSLIGPRPELPALVEVYEKEIPYYNARHLIKPGLSGWAQIYHQRHPHHGVSVDDTRDKLSYDLYYIKHRSFMLDIRIAMQTVKALISRQGV
ncbi:MAG: hypothetical protein RL536_62 [Candidatus Parcubacteria bacterium]|jgi:lipopolysaccharide/colanic/teichoic acid biosynthesis glycosyltransferase